MAADDKKLSEHFTEAELACKDCGMCEIDDRLIAALEELRALGPEPISVDAGYRCTTHNKEVGGVSKSQHLDGTAADIRIKGLNLQQQYERALRVPAFANGGIGVYDGNFIHVDVRDGAARWSRVRGKYGDISKLVKPAPATMMAEEKTEPPTGAAG